MGSGRRGGGGGRNLNMLRQHVESLRSEFSTAEEAVDRLRHHFPMYRRMKPKELTRLVGQILQSEGSSRKKRKSVDEAPSTSSYSSTSEDAVYEERFDLMKSMLRKSYGGGGRDSPCKEKIIELDIGDEIKERNKIAVSGGELGKGKGLMAGFEGLGGMRGVLEELEMEVFVPLYHPHVLTRLGVKPISGILLHGPPGCGKTKLAHAIATETGLPFYKVSATEVVSGVSGASEENIRELFSKAYRTAPSIVFIDEIDAIASKRENLQREMERRIVTQLMTCMDEYQKLVQPVAASSNSNGSDQSSGPVLVIGATNRPDAIDPALRRPGRFDREIELGVPDEDARVEILSVLTRNCTLEGSVDLLKISKSTPGFVGADLDALVKKAGNLATRRVLDQRKSKLSTEHADELVWWKRPWLPEEVEKLAITMHDFEEAAKRVQPSLRREGFSSIPNVTWQDVGGFVAIKHEFDLHVVRRMNSPEVYEKFGVDLETGILLYGPPGCGKTLIAKAVANKAGANFIYVKGPELLDKYVGESEQKVRTLFSRARTCSPCIIFFDEVDALTTKRGIEGGSAGERLLNQLLIELDGADQRSGVVVLGATNRPEVMDPAVLRPGRFGKLIYVPLPSSNDRGSILMALAKGKPIDSSVDLCAIGRMDACENFSGADLKNLMHEAAMAALVEAEDGHFSNDPCTIKMIHFEKALSKISPSVKHKQIQDYKAWMESFKGT